MKLNSILSKVICLLVAFTMVVPGLAFAADNKELPWDHNYNHSSYGMPFTPAEGYVSIQNPPDFKWGYEKTAVSYELIVAKDAELKDVVYNKADLDLPYLSIEKTLDTGIPLYWAVRYKDSTGKVSTWSTVRKFRIDPDAYEYVVPDIDVIVNNIPNTHPRTYTGGDLADFRSIKDRNETAKITYDYYVKNAQKHVKNHIIESEPKRLTRKDFATEVEYSKYFQTINSQNQGNIDRAIICGYAYLLTGEKSFGEFAVELVHAYCSWDAVHGLSSHEAQDQSNRHIMTYSALVYDWCYDLMTEQERKDIVEMICIRRQQVDHLLTSLDDGPYDSHGWTIFSMIGTVSYILAHDVPEAKDWLRKTIIGYTALLPVWSYQDGGWCQGTGYAGNSRPRFLQFGRVLYESGVDLFGKAWMRNAYLYNVYTAPFDSSGSFGDDGGRDGALSNANIAKEYAEHIHFMPGDKNNGVRKWMMEQVGGLNTSLPTTYFAAESYDAVEAVPPSDYQLSHEFTDIGWINMTNDLMDTNRILLSFKSSPYGSVSHSHADNNGIFIEAFGEPVLAHSGYYDSYGTDHHFQICHASAAHNTITVDTKGQKIQDITADGALTGYLTQIDFDLAMGDATPAYKGALGKFERAVIYVRPDMFVIVDDLEAKTPIKESNFEFWLNTPSKAEAYEEGNGARLTKGGTVLDATVHYPQKVNTYYNNIHAGSDMKEIIPLVRYTDSEVQKRIWFETEKVNKTKMIVTLDPHKSGDAMAYVDTEYFDEYVKMTFEDGSNVIVNITDDNRTITTKDGFTFDGLALAYNDESIMLVRGTFLKQGETELIRLQHTGSVVMGENELSISTYVDNKISINTNNKYVSGVESVTDYDGREATEAIGITWQKGQLVEAKEAVPATDKTEAVPAEYEVKESDDYITFDAWWDNYQLMLNGKRITTEPVYGEATVVIDGEATKVPLVGATRRDGKVSVSAIHNLEPKKYEIKYISDNLITNVPGVGQVANITALRLSADTAEPQKIELATVPIIDMMTEHIADADAFQPTVTILKEAEDYNKDKSVGVNVYTSRSFLSGGAGVSKLDTEGYKASYTVNVTEEGDYYFVAKYVAFNTEDSKRLITIDDKTYVINLPVTAGYGSTPEEWDVVKATVPIHLTPGEHEILVEPLVNQWNYDWIGLVKG